ncbi:MAG: TetR/AcrR family transcriptional regulator [Micromonosporaceae bacterium]
MAAGLLEFSERGFQAVTVDDIALRAQVSHGTFYLYFANKDALFGALAQQALDAMGQLADEFPVITGDPAGRVALRGWIERFQQAYAAHAAVIRVLSQADAVGQEAWESGLKLLFRLADAASGGMGTLRRRDDGARPHPDSPAHLTGLACLIMLERVSFLISAGVSLPGPEMTDRLTAIFLAAFCAA